MNQIYEFISFVQGKPKGKMYSNISQILTLESQEVIICISRFNIKQCTLCTQNPLLI
jgi:hypothetical protein